MRRRRWGGDESSAGLQSWWAGLLWGWQCDTYAKTHTHRGIPAIVLLIRLLLLWWRVEDITGMPLGHAVYTLVHMQPFFSDTHMHVIMMAE